MTIPALKITKNWFKSTTVAENNWDNIRNPLIAWANQLQLDLQQFVVDAFGSSYSVDNDGLPNLSQSLQDQISTLISGNVDLVGTNNSTWTIDLDGSGKVVLSSSGLTSARTMMFPDSDQVIVGNTATQTLTNKTLTSPTINTATLTVNSVDPPNSNARVASQSLGKGFVFCNSLGTILSSYNIASASKIGTGHYEVVLDRNFSSANNGIVLSTAFTSVSGDIWNVDGFSLDGETYTIYTTRGSTGSVADNAFYLGFMGTLV